MGRQEAFEIFRRDYSQNSAIEQKKAALKERYVEAKHLGECVNSARQKISKYPMQWLGNIFFLTQSRLGDVAIILNM